MWEGRINMKTFEVTESEIVSTDPRSDQFLKYPLSSKLMTAGPNRVPVGVPPD
jgi:hypothetical protein